MKTYTEQAEELINYFQHSIDTGEINGIKNKVEYAKTAVDLIIQNSRDIISLSESDTVYKELNSNVSYWLDVKSELNNM